MGCLSTKQRHYLPKEMNIPAGGKNIPAGNFNDPGKKQVFLIEIY
jgi:hypothetical protein